MEPSQREKKTKNHQFATLYDTWDQGDNSWANVGVSAGMEGDGQTVKAVGNAAEVEAEAQTEDKDGHLMFSYAVLTTRASPRMQWLHERWA